MRRRALGATGTDVSIVGLGAGALGDARTTDADADALLGGAIDRGITLIDTAPSYGASEERIGRALEARGRRDAIVLVTKGGYGVEGVADWTPDAVRLGIDAALRRLRTDRIDAFLFHSCPMHVLVRDDLLGELDRAKDSGKIRLRGYSGENEELAWAVASGRFDVIETSVSFLDRASLGATIAAASARGMGVLAKRPLGNAPWRFDEEPGAADLREAWRRHRVLAIDPSPLAWPEAAVRFASHAPGVSGVLVGTSSLAHLDAAAEAAERGPLDTDLLERFDAAWARAGEAGAWRGVI
ncbi:MAG: aldo/keto reductase [Deltaproteobacteria bacterium]|nr:aldo/keto reductase [Deltaproteobacteria bacterium]